MTITFPVVVSLISAIGFFSLTVRLRHFKVREKPPVSRADLSVEERQQKIKIARWICFAGGCFSLAGAFFLSWLAAQN
jgi:hypothetical protein